MLVGGFGANYGKGEQFYFNNFELRNNMAKKLIEFKYWYINRNDAGFITEATVRFNEGKLVKEGSLDVFSREKKLDKSETPKITNSTKIGNGVEHFVYTSADFGSIKTDKELYNFMLDEVRKITTHEPITEQLTKK